MDKLPKKAMDCVPPGRPDVANLPAGEVYFVPTNASGSFPFRYSDGTIAEMVVEDGSITKAVFIQGNDELVVARNEQLKSDPATGTIGELGLEPNYCLSRAKIFKMKKSLNMPHCYR